MKVNFLTIAEEGEAEVTSNKKGKISGDGCDNLAALLCYWQDFIRDHIRLDKIMCLLSHNGKMLL